LTWRKIRAILQLRQESQNMAVPAQKFEYFIIEKLNLQKKNLTLPPINTGVVFL
jgi:hypothetical protein